MKLITSLVANIIILLTLQTPPDIRGEWVLEKSEIDVYDYPIVIFSDSGKCILTSIGDTMYHGNYELFDDTLIIHVKENRYANPILYINSEKMTLKTFVDITEQVTYVKYK